MTIFFKTKKKYAPVPESKEAATTSESPYYVPNPTLEWSLVQHGVCNVPNLDYPTALPSGLFVTHGECVRALTRLKEYIRQYIDGNDWISLEHAREFQVLTERLFGLTGSSDNKKYVYLERVFTFRLKEFKYERVWNDLEFLRRDVCFEGDTRSTHANIMRALRVSQDMTLWEEREQIAAAEKDRRSKKGKGKAKAEAEESDRDTTPGSSQPPKPGPSPPPDLTSDFVEDDDSDGP